MNYSYEILEVRPKGLFAKVKFYAEGQEDVIRNIRITDFEEESVHKTIESIGYEVVAIWLQTAKAPEEVVFESAKKDVVYAPPVEPEKKETIINEIPEFNEFTQRLDNDFEETDTAFIYTYKVVELTEKEQVEYLTYWRSSFFITPRQARLELAKRGQLANIDTIIASLPAEQQEIVQIEWEYAVSIERSSPWVIQLGSALGLDEEGLDQLFIAAAVL